MPRCLVTGATGFIGPRLVPVLQAAGGDVACLVRPTADTSRLEPLGVQLVTGDVTKPETLDAAVAGVDFVFHLAGRVFAPSYEKFAQVNVAGCSNIAAACAMQANPPVLVVASSLAAAGPSPASGAHTERNEAAPISNYGRSKLDGELAAREWAAEVPTTIVRPPVVFGQGDSAGLVLAKGIQRTGLHIVHRPGLPLSLVHADDLSQALLLVARHGERLDPTDPRGTGLYYAADPTVSSYTEMGQMIADALEQRLRVIRVRKWAMAVAGTVGELTGRLRGKESPLNLDKFREGTASGWVASPEKLMNQTAFAPAKSLAEHYRDTIDWYRKKGWLAK
ncbi:NAD-dependent epimerase/dehydratase family protein [Aeoliella mucimassa]|uniref:dTDP-6-deoxy-L-talose 4-dehydrogenase (NAD(P)(+)) n=1 Tax=Aeoliella mucimassa TaxID=2527972 RepID=A0A518ARR8_9BACT|nr:NAD-dependent epimerase/dehydratase family protein [Aeoliella mucimassa]QDU57412.1 dTDP-6-deoxy-L-talose 4-dehydrogenase (NAD(P)(+)) [Aeoliella mucimassa]